MYHAALDIFWDPRAQTLRTPDTGLTPTDLTYHIILSDNSYLKTRLP